MGSKSGKVSARTMQERFRARFWQQPRPHGEIIPDRTVSFLELFYDLVYVVLIARAAHTLAHHISWRGAGEFAAVFGLIWIAWLNGTLHHELHSRQDGRTRTFMFVQMTLLATLAIYTGDAAGDDGAGFAFVYSLLLLVLTWLWYSVRRVDDEQYNSITGRYIGGMLISVAVMLASISLSNEARIWAWGALVLVWVVFGVTQFGQQLEVMGSGFAITHSMIERFGLFTIIVLGEVVVGVVDGLSEVERDATTIATGLIGLQIGFGFWWSYFDFVGRREPRVGRYSIPIWLYGHLPLSMAIASAGAAMVGLVEHANDAHAPAPASWLLTGSTALLLLSLAAVMRSLQDYESEQVVYRQVIRALLVSGVIVLALGVWQPSPLVLVTTVAAVLGGVWWFAVDRWLRQSKSRAGFEAFGGS